MSEIGLFEAMYTARALRRFKPDPVPDEVMTKVLDAAIRAPSGSNAQSWLFVVVKDAEERRQLGAIYHKASQILTTLYAERPRASHFTEEQYRRFWSSVTYLFDHMHEAPVLLLACLKSAPAGAASSGLSPEVQSALVTSLKSAGFDVRVVEGKRDGHEARRWLKTLPPATATPSDASASAPRCSITARMPRSPPWG